MMKSIAKHVLTISLLVLLSAWTVSAQHLDKKAVKELRKACLASHSSGLAIWVDGKEYLNESYDTLSSRQVAAHSALKSLISLTIGSMISSGLLSSIDTPVYAFYPEWKQGLKKQVTLRHLLNHTSGIDDNPSDPDSWAVPDIVQYALCASVVDTPGTKVWYNSTAVSLIHGIIRKIHGKGADHYIDSVFFKPIGIKEYHWGYDKAGNPSLLYISPGDFVKIGQLVLNNGTWNGRPIVSEAWLSESLKQGQPFWPNCGLLWWRIPEKVNYVVDDSLLAEFRLAGVSDSFIKVFSQLKGSYENVNLPEEKLVLAFGPDWHAVLDKKLYAYYPRRARWVMSKNIIGYKAEGWLGQYIIIYPDKKLVACRMVHESKSYNSATDEMLNFEQLVYPVVK
jgi:CubicO group peptidase (beta-lactamase class C family)